jgi:hypothetical protein
VLSRRVFADAGAAALPYADHVESRSAAMPFFHYGSELSIELDRSATKMVTEDVGAHASRGGWVSVTDVTGRTWTFLVTAGVPIWLNEED